MEKEDYEERTMTTYVASSKEMCARLSKNKCLGPFKDVRIIVIGKDLTRKKKKEKKREAVELFFFFFLGIHGWEKKFNWTRELAVLGFDESVAR